MIMRDEKEFPSIGFRDGIGGQEAFVLGHRVAVWEVLDVYRKTQSVSKTARYYRWPTVLVRRALKYAKAYPAAIKVQREAEGLLKGFRAVEESRRWRIATGRKLRGLSFEQQQKLLNRGIDGIAKIQALRTPKQLIAATDKLSPSQRLRIVAFAHAVDIFGSAETAASWWDTGNPYLRGRKPSTCSGERVMALLKRIEHNLP